MTTEQANQLKYIYDKVGDANIIQGSINQAILLGIGRSFNIKNIVGASNISKYNTSDFLVGWQCPEDTTNTAPTSGASNLYPRIIKDSEFVLSYNNTNGDVTIAEGRFTLLCQNNSYVYGRKQYDGDAKVWLLCKTPNPVLP